MRTVKDAAARKNEILDAAEALFNQKGYDATTISDIIEQVGIARGLVYYHFKSKEDVLDALINRMGAKQLAAAKQMAQNKSIPPLERLIQTVMAMSVKDDTAMLANLHKPQNALMHQKTHQLMMEGIPPILAEIIEDGIRQGLYNTPYPYESMEMVVAHINTVFEDEYMSRLTPEELQTRIMAFLFNLERIFGAEPGSLHGLLAIFQADGGQNA